MTAPLKTHVAVNTNRFEESVRFYRAFFGRAPVKLKAGYAKFDVESPPLNFTLNESPAREPGLLGHLGVQVSSTAEVTAASERLRAAGLATREEMGTDCCHAVQDKVWVKDPNGIAWEVFVVTVADTTPDQSVTLEQLEARCCATKPAAACC